MKIHSVSLLLLGALAALQMTGCNPASKDGGKSISSLPDAVVLESAFDWDSVDREKPVTVLHKWTSSADDVPRIAASDASGTRVAFVDKSKKIADSYAVWVVQSPGTDAVEVLGLKHRPEKLYMADTGNAVFAVASDAGYLYSLSEGKVAVRIDYDKCSAAAGLSPDGKYVTAWGGSGGKVYHFSTAFNYFSENEYWGMTDPSNPEDVYCANPVSIFPSYGITQFILQTGTAAEPECTLISLNTSQHTYGYRANLEAYFTRGIRSKDGRFYRSLGGPKENYGGRTESGEIPFTHLASINLQTLSFDMEPIGMIFAKKPLAINRAGSEVAAHSEDGGIDIYQLKSGKIVRKVPKSELGEYEIVAFAGDLLGLLVKTDAELKWFNLRKFDVKAD